MIMTRASISLDVNLNSFNKYIFVVTRGFSAQPHLYVLSGGLWQVSVEPWRVVEGTAGVTATPLTIPNGVSQIYSWGRGGLSITEVMVANKCWRSSTGTYSSSESPDVPSAGPPICQADTINIVRVY